MTSFAQVKQEIQRASSLVSRAFQELEAGGIVDLSSLEQQVDMACAWATNLPSADGRALKPVMISLIADLDRLSDGLTRQHEMLKNQLDDTGTRYRATSAYARKPAENK